jgi:RecA-family ATPase
MNALSDSEIEQGKFAHPSSAAGIKPLDIAWLWKGFLPLGALSLLYGHEGLGKSVLTALIAAKATRGELDGDLKGKPTDVEIVAYEDDPAAVLVPRLLAAGADLDRIWIHGDGLGAEPLTLPDDAESFGHALRARESRLVIVDPLPDSLREGLKDNNNGDVRKALIPLHSMAQAVGCCVLGVTHPNKGATEAANKVMGSKAWRSVPRSVLIYGCDPGEPDGETRILAVSKANYARKQAIKLRVREVAVEGVDKPQAAAEAVGASAYTDQDLIAARAGAAATPTAGQAAERLLYRLLEDAGGEVDAKTAYAAAEAAGISKTRLREVRKAMGVTGGTVWAMPDEQLPV